MAFKVSPVAILELAALEEEAAAAAAEAPAFAALVAAVAAGGVTRRIADNIATYDLSSLRGGVSSLRAAVDGAAAVAAPRAPVDADAVLGRPPPRPGLMSLAEACGALLGLRVALVACVDGARDGSDAPTAPAGAAGGLARIEAARTARLRALASLRRLPRAAAEEVDCARAFLDERWVAADLRQTMEGCLEDAPLPFPSAAARAELGAHAAFRAAEADVTARAALRASGGRLELAFLRFRRLERDGAATAATAALAALCRRHAALCRAVALSDWAAVRLYDEVLVRSATVSDLPDDGPLRRLEAADDGGDGAARAAVRDRRVVARCVVALRRAAARGAWEASDDPADVSVADALHALLEGAPDALGAASRAVATLPAELKRAEDELARRAGLRRLAADRAAVALRARGPGEAYLPGVGDGGGRAFGAGARADRWWDVDALPPRERAGLGYDAAGAADALALRLGDPVLGALAARERDLLRYAYAEFRDVAGLDGAGAAEAAAAGATRAGAGQLREARAFARELRFFDCARAWDAATRGLRGERSAWLLGGGDGDPRDGGDGDPTRLDLRALKSGPLVDGLARLARLLEADGAAGASWDGADDDDDDDGAGTPPLRRLQRLRVARRVVSDLRGALAAVGDEDAALAGAGAAAAAAYCGATSAGVGRLVAAARSALAALRHEAARVDDAHRYKFLNRGAGAAQFAVEREARRLLAPALHAACAAICGGTPPAGAALADAARALRGARSAARAALADLSLGPWRTRYTERLLLSARALAAALDGCRAAEAAVACLRRGSREPAVPDDSAPPPGAAARSDGYLAAPGGATGAVRAGAPGAPPAPAPARDAFADDEEGGGEAPGALVGAARAAWAARAAAADALAAVRAACSCRRGVAGAPEAAAVSGAQVGMVVGAVKRAGEALEALAVAAPGGAVANVNGYDVSRVRLLLAAASALRALRAMCVAAHLRRGAARENLDHGRALAAMAEVFAGFRAGRVGARDGGGACPVANCAALPARPADGRRVGGDGDVPPAAARPPWTAFSRDGARAVGGALAVGGARSVRVSVRLCTAFSPDDAALVLARYDERPHDRDEVEGPGDGRLRVARGLAEVAREVRLARVALEDRRVRASLGRALDCDTGRCDAAYFHAESPRADVGPALLARVVAAAAARPTSASAIAGRHGLRVSGRDARLLARTFRGDAADEDQRELRLDADYGGGDAEYARLQGVARAAVALDGEWHWAPRRASRDRGAAWPGDCAGGAGPHHAQLSPLAFALLQQARLLVCVRAALYAGPTGAAILDALHGPDGAREVARFAGGSVHDRLVDTGALADRLWVDARAAAVEAAAAGPDAAGAAVAVEIRADAPGATQLARDSALAPTLASLGRLRRRHPAAALELAYAALSLHFIQFCAAARGALAAMRLAGPVGSPGARALDAGAADRVLAEAWDGAAGLGLRTLPCAAHVAATLRACADARRRLARREWRAGAAAAAGLAAAAAELLAAPWRMQEYEHAYVELVADDAARLSAEFEHHRVLAGLRASCAAAAFSSGAGGAHDAAEDFAAPCLVEDPVAADFEYLWDSQDPGVAAWRARGGPGVPRGAPWPAVPFLEPGGASPWALDADAPSIVEDRAWRRQLVALRGALAAARAQRHRLPRDARAAYATAAACLALHCALRLRDWRAVKAALALRLRDGGLDHGLLGPQTRLARSLADRHDAAELLAAALADGRPETRPPADAADLGAALDLGRGDGARARALWRETTLVCARVDVVRLGAALRVARRARPAARGPREAALVAAAELALAWRTILARLDGPAAAAAPPLPRVGRVLAAVSHFEAAALYTHCLVEHGEVRAAVAYDAAVRTVVAKSRAPWRRDALERLRDALQDPGAASHVADERHNDFSRVDLAGLDDALHQARAVERKSPELDAAIASAMAVRDKRAELKRRFAKS
ncbi:hypothetical protein AURANDRAFT_72781 [Aureococcus anophagefferens]|uniref:Uncharacterized protein n=1 Tax=Aureococcus anophagefferens TaxID=44056 RepID=F0YNY5_AURAN|nr:hypothetical protein AURANDRAFT_72781 [Aureococcus anophagefferens]EGB03178.1 hypothetical protein AURANDRAFT_72781 [Aureococcus anophagefferens]|eukprot:XP_009042130.1 hypothetical protein AURANDRAFT_72781 [Aureococcus anophagefferens]